MFIHLTANMNYSRLVLISEDVYYKLLNGGKNIVVDNSRETNSQQVKKSKPRDHVKKIDMLSENKNKQDDSSSYRSIVNNIQPHPSTSTSQPPLPPPPPPPTPSSYDSSTSFDFDGSTQATSNNGEFVNKSVQTILEKNPERVEQGIQVTPSTRCSSVQSEMKNVVDTGVQSDCNNVVDDHTQTLQPPPPSTSPLQEVQCQPSKSRCETVVSRLARSILKSQKSNSLMKKSKKRLRDESVSDMSITSNTTNRMKKVKDTTLKGASKILVRLRKQKGQKRSKPRVKNTISKKIRLMEYEGVKRKNIKTPKKIKWLKIRHRIGYKPI